MLISKTHEFVFIKCRKIGGTSLEKYIIDNHFDLEKDICTGSIVDNIPWINIDEHSRGHMHWGEISVREAYVKNYHKFTIERNPWDKCVSQYFFFRDKIHTIPKDMSFSEFLESENRLPKDFFRYKSAPDCHVLKYENLREDLEMFFKGYTKLKFNYNQFMTYNLKSGIRKDSHYSHMYESDEQIERVAKVFEHEIGLLGYGFEDHR